MVLRANISMPASLHPQKVLVQAFVQRTCSGAKLLSLSAGLARELWLGRVVASHALALSEVASFWEKKGPSFQMWSHKFCSFPLSVAAELAQGQHLVSL